MPTIDGKILCRAYPVKYRIVEYSERYVTIEQNRTRRRIPVGYFFEDTGTHIYVSSFYADIFQHKEKSKMYLLDRKTKEWEEVHTVMTETHRPGKIEPRENNIVEDLRK